MRHPFTQSRSRPIKALDGGKSRTKEVRAENSRLSRAACKLEAESSKFGMAGSPGML
jgi:hypothetical protein